ncbi:MAG TPA: bifunctional serine/threonine-protein kinase/formylglycine-generating enzyme family protein [Gemmataceae bacterium]|nr:bifunctional serine/threonine-protein kinase/formylglycine-generating enzyme family protein [Gemmataceae bacterium]
MPPAGDPTAAFLAAIRQSNLLPAARLTELEQWVHLARPDVQALAKEINRRGWLTPYQIKEIFKGNGKALTFGPYVLLDLLGEGGMGRVFKAHQKRLGRDVALKIIRREKLNHPAAEARFNQEVEALAKMTHPNVVTVFDADVVGDVHYYSMELIDGTDLTKMVRDRGKLPMPEACEYVRLAALGLQHAHEKNLVHRDIKPSNILVSRNGRTVKLVDLGLARLMETAPGAEEAGRLTQEGFVIGTPDFLAPEQARNPGAVDIRADIYALGGTLFYILTGRVPFDGANATEKLLKHCTSPIPSLRAYRPDAPPQLDQLIQWCLAKRAEDRPQTPLALAVALQPFCPPPVAGSGNYAAPAVRQLPVPQVVYDLPPLESDPGRSSQIFKLPQRPADDPIRRRAAARGFPTGPVLVTLGVLFVVGLLGYAVYRNYSFTSADAPPPPDETFTNASGLKMVWLGGGAFQMGSPEKEPGRRPKVPGVADEEGPRHEVTLRPFFIAATEVTQGQYAKVMGVTAATDLDLPVRRVTFDEAVEFCKRVTEKEKSHPNARKGWAYRLPTEAEWEYAARGGTDTPFGVGDGDRLFNYRLALFTHDETDPTGDGGLDSPPERPGKVGAFGPNKFDLYDMHGNVAEWCGDWFKRGYPSGPRDNPTGPPTDDKRVVRGGSYKDPASMCRSAARQGVRPAERRETIGFRVVYAPAK